MDLVTNEPVPLVVRVDTKAQKAFCIKKGSDGKVLMNNNRLTLFEHPNPVKVMLEGRKEELK